MQDRATLRSDPIGMDGSRLFYGIDFCSDGIGYFCDIDAATGDVIAAGWSWVRPSRKEAAAAPVKAGKKMY